MDQEQGQNPEASQPEVQPAVDAIETTEVSEPVVTTEQTYTPPAESTPQPESAPVNPFAAPETNEPAPAPISVEPTPAAPPFAAGPQIGPAAPTFATTPTPASAPVTKKSHKGLIIGLIVGFVVLLAAAGAVGYIWFTNFYVSKADYQQVSSAWTQIHDINSSLSSMGSAVSSSTVSASDITSKVDELDSKVQSLGDLRAVQKDADLKKAYDAFLPNIHEQIVASRAVASFVQASSDCGMITVKEMVTTCITELRAVKDESTGGKVKALASAMANYVEGAVAGKVVSYSAQESDLTAYSKDLENKVADTGNAFSNVLSKKI